MIELRTGCRLHFGLMELCPGQPHRYAGLGVMLHSPGMHVRVSWDSMVPDLSLPSSIEKSRQLDTASINEYASRIGTWLRSNNDSNVELLNAFPFHSGLGAGTQLACLLAVAKQFKLHSMGHRAPSQQLNEQSKTEADSETKKRPAGQSQPPDDWQSVSSAMSGSSTQKLAEWSERGLRSAIGLQGFLSGGLILDHGYESQDSSLRMVRVDTVQLPHQWRFVLIRGSNNSAITGPLETSLIGEMAAKPNVHCQRMYDLARQAMQQAKLAQFNEFCQYLEQYMQYAGDMFAPIQGGRYNGAVCAQAVSVANQFGLKAVGQSSWGPTIFGLAPDDEAAQQIAARIANHASNWQVEVAAASPGGAEVRSVGLGD